MTIKRDSTSGQGYRERSDTSSAVGGPNWCQQLFIPPDNVEVTTRVLYDLQGRRGRYQVEVADPVTKELLALRSRPFHQGLSARETYEEAYKWGCEAVEALCNPDPFP